MASVVQNDATKMIVSAADSLKQPVLIRRMWQFPSFLLSVFHWWKGSSSNFSSFAGFEMHVNSAVEQHEPFFCEYGIAITYIFRLKAQFYGGHQDACVHSLSPSHTQRFLCLGLIFIPDISNLVRTGNWIDVSLYSTIQPSHFICIFLRKKSSNYFIAIKYLIK